MANSFIGDEGVLILLDMSGTADLLKLNLTNNGLTDEAAVALANSPISSLKRRKMSK